jgi:hypothetical protein
MKKILSITIILLAGFGLIKSYPQPIPVYPIPSYDVTVNGYANFRQDYSSMNTDQREAKREVNVQIKSGTHSCQATVWVYTLDRTTVLGPYTVYCDNTLTVDIDENEWGVLVQSEEDVLVSVWFGQAELLRPKGIRTINNGRN